MLWCVISALVGAVSLAVAFVAWALLEEAKEARWASAIGPLGRPLG